MNFSSHYILDDKTISLSIYYIDILSIVVEQDIYLDADYLIIISY